MGANNYIEEKEIEEIIKRKIDESLNENHIRATHGKLSDALEYDEEYEDY